MILKLSPSELEQGAEKQYMKSWEYFSPTRTLSFETSWILSKKCRYNRNSGYTHLQPLPVSLPSPADSSPYLRVPSSHYLFVSFWDQLDLSRVTFIIMDMVICDIHWRQWLFSLQNCLAGLTIVPYTPPNPRPTRDRPRPTQAVPGMMYPVVDGGMAVMGMNSLWLDLRPAPQEGIHAWYWNPVKTHD